MTALSSRLGTAAVRLAAAARQAGAGGTVALPAGVVHALSEHLGAECERAQIVEQAHLGVTVDHAMGVDLVALVKAIEDGR